MKSGKIIKFLRIFQKPQTLFLIVLFLTSLVLRLYRVSLAPFDHDQQIPAQFAYDFFRLHKTSLIGQELSFMGFFLGPLHNTLELIPYGFCKLDPVCVPYFYTFVGALIIISLYLIVKSVFNKKTAIISSAFFSIAYAAINHERAINSNFFLVLSQGLLLYCLHKYFQNKNYYLPLAAFVCGIAVVNFNPVFIFSALTFAAISLLRRKKEIYIYAVSAIAFGINYLPLIVFNLRHQNLLLNNFKVFMEKSAGLPVNLDRILFVSKDIVLPFYTNFFFQSRQPFFAIITLLLIIVGAKIVLKEKNYYLYLPLLIIVTFVSFIFYQGQVSEYYFWPTLLPVVILVAKTLQKNTALLISFLLLFIYSNLNYLYKEESHVNLKIKKEVVSYIEEDTSTKSFKLYNDMPRGLNTGYDYLFKIAKSQPVPDGENLYILAFGKPELFYMENYYKTFRNQDINLKVFGYVEVVSVKNKANSRP